MPVKAVGKKVVEKATSKTEKVKSVEKVKKAAKHGWRPNKGQRF